MYESRAFAGLKHTPSLGSVDVSSTSNASAKVYPPSGMTVALIQGYGLTQTLGRAEVWLPVGAFYTIGTTVATGTPVLSAARNGTAITGATITIPTATNSSDVLWVAMANYTFPTAWAAGDYLTLKVTTTNSATGAITPYLAYVPIAFGGVSEAETDV